MNLPKLSELNETRKQISEFKGYNHNPSIGDGEMYDMYNLSSDNYPLLSNRKPRGFVRSVLYLNGLFSKGQLIYVDDNALYYGDNMVGYVSPTPKKFVSMGAYLIIMPDKMYYNTATGDFGSLESVFVLYSSGTLSKCDINGNASSTGVYTKITATGIGTHFNQYDGVSISGGSDTAINGTKIISSKGTDYIVIPAVITADTGQASDLIVMRQVPDMDFVVECDNRLWGCSSASHQIYASKLGDPFNWNCFEGISTDSYVATIGSDGNFTGAFTYMGYVTFFKEDMIHRVHGSKPSNYQIYNNVGRGVAEGCEKSLCLVNEVLYYVSRTGVVAYNGSSTEDLSYNFGEEKYTDAVAGSIDGKYYVSMRNWIDTIFVYDSNKGMWHKEDNVRASWFTYFDGNLYYYDNTERSIKTVTETDMYHDYSAINWEALFSDYSDKDLYKKYISKLIFKVELGAGAVFEVLIQYDKSDTWTSLTTFYSSGRKVYNVPVNVRRAEDYQLKIAGYGNFKLYSIVKVIKEGSEL